MKNQHCSLKGSIVLLLWGACVVYGPDVTTCEFSENYECTVNVTERYGFNIYSPDLLDQFPIHNETQFIELCSDYISMVNCLKVNKPCDHLSRRYNQYALALAKALDYACREDVLADYAAVVSCFHIPEVEGKFRSCQRTLRKSVQDLVNDTVESASESGIDISVVVEKACQYLISSMDCTDNVLLDKCSLFVKDWYHTVFTEMIDPTLRDYRCQLYMPISKTINLFFVCFAGTIIICVIIYVCVQRYKSFMRGRMNFVLSVLPKARHTLQNFDPKRISKSMKSSKTSTAVPTTEQRASAAEAAPDASTVTQPPAIDAATAYVLEQLAKATHQIAPGQRNSEAKARASARISATTSATTTSATAPAATAPSTSSRWGWFN